MTFMDDYHHDSEVEAYKNTKSLLIWLGPIAPVPSKLSQEVASKLLEMCNELGWPVIKDENIGEILK